jgi:hypothetical protein
VDRERRSWAAQMLAREKDLYRAPAPRIRFESEGGGHRSDGRFVFVLCLEARTFVVIVDVFGGGEKSRVIVLFFVLFGSNARPSMQFQRRGKNMYFVQRCFICHTAHVAQHCIFQTFRRPKDDTHTHMRKPDCYLIFVTFPALRNDTPPY